MAERPEELTDRDMYLLHRYGLSDKDISFIMRYATDEEFMDFIDRIKKADTLEYRNEQKEKAMRHLERIRKRSFEKECKCAVGAVIIDEMFRENIISDYRDILEEGTNTLSRPVSCYISSLLNRKERGN